MRRDESETILMPGKAICGVEGKIAGTICYEGRIRLAGCTQQEVLTRS